MLRLAEASVKTIIGAFGPTGLSWTNFRWKRFATLQKILSLLQLPQKTAIVNINTAHPSVLW